MRWGASYHEVRREGVLEVGHLGVGVLVAERLDRAVRQYGEDAQQVGQLGPVVGIVDDARERIGLGLLQLE
jgi:hypothetical protein